MSIKLVSLSVSINRVFGIKRTLIEPSTLQINSNEGQIVSFIMPEGSGKTSFASVLSGIKPAENGDLLINGKNPFASEKLPLITAQHNTLPWLSVKKNVEFRAGLGTANTNAVRKALELTGLDGYEDHFPEDYAFGFRFRMALAGCIAAGSGTIILDDSFKLMDREAAKENLQFIKTISKTHKLQFLLVVQSPIEAFEVSDYIIPFDFVNKTFTDVKQINDSTREQSLRDYVQHHTFN